MRQRNNIAADAGHFWRTEIDSTNFTNEELTAKVRRNKAESSYVFKKVFQKILKETKAATKLPKKNIRQKNK